MATYTRHFNAETRRFFYKKHIVSVSEFYMGYDSYGRPSYFHIYITPVVPATTQDFFSIQKNPALAENFFRDGDAIYKIDVENMKIETISNKFFWPRTIDWAIEQAKEIVNKL
jgi:hypothetical protein